MADLFTIKTAEGAIELINSGADVNAKDMYGSTPLNYVTSRLKSCLPSQISENVKIAKILITHGADVNNTDMSTPLFNALLQFRDTQIAKLLIEKGANVKIKDSTGLAPLHIAVMNDYCCNNDIVELLISHGADVNAKDNSKNTPLHFVHFAKTAKLLIEKGANVNIKNQYGQTPLHCTKNPEITKVLLKYGAHINVKDNLEQTPLDCTQNEDQIRILSDHGAKINNLTERLYRWNIKSTSR
ncbi:MAG: ankyrin repeat domain-containing protein [Alphaproteobacteria bacterium]|nr:ankyrin repeat domain-containing protein [Alphaproteobacteria bacterium]